MVLISGDQLPRGQIGTLKPFHSQHLPCVSRRLDLASGPRYGRVNDALLLPYVARRLLQDRGMHL